MSNRTLFKNSDLDRSQHRHWFFGASCFILGVTLLFIRDTSVHIASSNDIQHTRDLVWVTEDNPQNWPFGGEAGCDAVSVFDLAQKEEILRPVFTSTQYVSPGRMWLTRDLSRLTVSYSNYSRNFEPFIFIVNMIGTDIQNWNTNPVIAVDFGSTNKSSYLSSVALIDSDLLLLSRYSLLNNNGYRIGPFFLESYSLSELKKHPNLELRPTYKNFMVLGNFHNRIPIDGMAIGFFEDQKAQNVLHVVTDTPSVYTIDVKTMSEVSDRIRVPFTKPRVEAHRHSISMIHADVSQDGRYIIINGGWSDEIQVVDLDKHELRSISIAGLEFSGDVAMNKGWVHPGVLAIHALDRVILADLNFTGREPLEPLASISITRAGDTKIPSATLGPFPSLAWNTSGRSIVAAGTGRGSAEFVVIDVNDDKAMSIRSNLMACPQEPNWPNDILSANGLITPTSIVVATATEVTSTPTATRTPQITATSTSASITNTPVPVATLTTTPTPTQIMRLIFLPVMVSEAACNLEFQYTDTVLVIDASSSMVGNRIIAAKAAATIFVESLRLSNDHDRAAIVAFNNQAHIMSTLTDDLHSLEAAIDNIRLEPGTRIDQGLQGAWNELKTTRHTIENIPVVIVLTDGHQDETPNTAQRIAADMRNIGIVIHVIGLGEDVNGLYLEQLAGSPARYHFAPSEIQLIDIYRSIIKVIPCAPETFWGHRP